MFARVASPAPLVRLWRVWAGDFLLEVRRNRCAAYLLRLPAAAWLILATLITVAWPVVLVGCCLAMAGVSAWRQTRSLPIGSVDIDALTPRQFEEYVATVIGALPGYRAYATPASADQGADVVVVGPGGKRIVVQVKHYRHPVGNRAVQEIVAAKGLYRADRCVVVTSGPGYTRAALRLAAANGVQLWGRDELMRRKCPW